MFSEQKNYIINVLILSVILKSDPMCRVALCIINRKAKTWGTGNNSGLSLKVV